MELQTPTTTDIQLLSMFCRRCGMFRGSFHPAKAFLAILVLSCTFFFFATCGPCSANGMQKSAEYGASGSYGDKQQARFQDIVSGDASSGYIVGSSMTHPDIESVCTSSNLLCFPSTLPGFFPKEHNMKRDALEVSRIQSDSPLSIATNQANRGTNNATRLSQNGMFMLLNGRTVSCLLNSGESTLELSSVGADSSNQNGSPSCRHTLLNQNSNNVGLKKNNELSKPGSFDVSSSPKVGISPPTLDWGNKYLFFPSVAFLTVVNSLIDSVLHIYEPFSTNTQFYPCNSSEILLGPGEVALICFVFLPRWLGLSTAHLILQTSSGGFLVPAKGFGVESPYKIQPLVDLDVLSSGRLIKNISLFNPYDETLHAVEVTSWISVSVGNTTYHAEASCNIDNLQNLDEFGLPSVNDWLVVRTGQVGSPLMAMRPHRSWEISPHSTETIMEMDFPLGFEGKIFGAFCMQLLRSPLNMSDTVMVPLEIDLDAKVASNDHTGPVSVYIDSLMSYDAGGNVVAISLKNGASYMLNVVRISEVAETKNFQIKHVEGLLLFPGTITQVAVITYAQLHVELLDCLPEASDINKSCKLLILTNDSSSPQIEIPCQDIIRVCSRCQKDSSLKESGNIEAGNSRTGSLSGNEKMPSDIKAVETAEADELVLGNWKSQGKTSGMSVLDDHEVLFPMVQIGSHHSKWITVKNPSQQPVVMQLILNSGEIIDECRDTDGFVEPSSGNLVYGKSTRPTRYGFSIAESALTEAYVHPHGRASFGPILFHPSNRCAWSSSALIRNNLSGVEWLSLRGFGVSLSLGPFEGSEPLKKFAIVVVLVVSLIFLVFCCLYLQMITLGSQYCFYKDEKSSITAISTVGKSSHLHQNHRNSRISVPGEMNCLLRSVDEPETSKQASSGRYPDSQMAAPEMISQHAKFLTLENHEHTDGSSDTQREKAVPCLSSKSVVVKTSDSIEESHINNLTVRLGKEKGRRRRKRKGGGATLKGVLDVSSSQSGNSTPSSPLSPVTTLTLNRACLLSPDVNQLNESRHLFTQMGDRCSEKDTVPEPASEPKVLEPQLPLRSHSNSCYSSSERHSVPGKTASKRVLLPSATFPCAARAAPSLLCSHSLASKSTIAPHARAPGSELYQKTVTGEQAERRDDYAYDIWGDHFSRLSLIGRSKGADSINHSATRNDSDSFFVSGPQTLVRYSQLRSVSCFNQGG